MFACMFCVCVFVLFHVCVLFHVYVIASCLCVVAFCVLMTLYELDFFMSASFVFIEFDVCIPMSKTNESPYCSNVCFCVCMCMCMRVCL